MWVAFAVAVGLFVLLGIVFINGKGAFLIAGYNTSSKAEKAKYDEKALCKFMGKMMFLFALCFAIAAFSDFLNSMIPMWVGMSLFLGTIVFMLIYANTGNRFKK